MEETEEDSQGEDEITPDMFSGDGGQQAMQYMMALLKKDQLSKKRMKGKAPSSEHFSHLGPAAKRPKVQPELHESSVEDPDFVLPVVKKGEKVKGRGRGAGRGKGRGRGRGSASNSNINVSTSSVVSMSLNSTSETGGNKGTHWKLNELTALMNAANKMKPVLKGRFKHATDGVTLKALAWNEVKGEKYIYTFLFM